MSLFAKIVALNLAILLAYSLAIRMCVYHTRHTLEVRDSSGLMIAIPSAYAIAIHVGVCLLFALLFHVIGRAALTRAWAGTAGVVLVVGFSVCLGNASF